MAAIRPIAAILLLLTSCCAFAQPHHKLSKSVRHQSRQIIDQLEEQWRNAILSGNTTRLKSLLADDYMAITPFGTLQDKEQTLADLRSGRWRFTSLTMSNRKVRFYGRTALVTSQAQVQASTPEGKLSGSFLYTRVYARDARGNWKIVNFEANRMHGGRLPKHQTGW